MLLVLWVFALHRQQYNEFLFFAVNSSISLHNSELYGEFSTSAHITPAQYSVKRLLANSDIFTSVAIALFTLKDFIITISLSLPYQP